MVTAVSKLSLLRNTNDSIFSCQTNVTPVTDIRMTSHCRLSQQKVKKTQHIMAGKMSLSYITYIKLVKKLVRNNENQCLYRQEHQMQSAPRYKQLEFGMYPQSMPTEWTHARTLRRWQSVRLDL